MAVTTQRIAVPPDVVFAALVDPETYPHWLIGCKDIRAVDDGWPQPGTRFHHRVGIAGPLTVADSTKVIDIVEPRRLVLEVRARPFGRGQSTFVVRADGAGAMVDLEEHPIGMLAPLAPLLTPLIAHRNEQSLRNLAAFVTGEDLSPKAVPPQGAR